MFGKFLAILGAHLLKEDWDLVLTHMNILCASIERFPSYAPSRVAQCLLVSGEDHRHAQHPGFDWIAVGRACWRRLSRGTHEGASTIEQQIVRVLTGRYERTIMRKVREIMLAVLVVRKFGKRPLPAVYLLIGYYGYRMNGFHQACRELSIPAHAASFEDAAQLVARLKYPQPSEVSAHRKEQIERRAKHLISLYRKHVLDGTYRHIDDQTFRYNSAIVEPIAQP